MNPVPFSWMIVAMLALGAVSGCAGLWYGYRYADRAAEISNLNDKLKTAAETIKAKQEEAKANAAITAAFSQRALGDAQTFQSQIQEPIDDISGREASKPAGSVCMLDGPELRELLDLARRAQVPQADPSRRP